MARIAYLGPGPDKLGGVAGVAGQVLRGLVDLGHEVDCYVARLEAPLPAGLDRAPRFAVIDAGSRFRYDAWYSRTELAKFVSGQTTRAIAEIRLARELVGRHARTPYDVLYQFSHLEVLGLDVAQLPPLVIHPETHAAGELRWVRRERALARRCEPPYRRLATGMLLCGRSAVQRRQARQPRGFICPSRAFQRVFCADYSVDPRRTRVVHNPVDLNAFRPIPESGSAPVCPVRVLFVGRISVRKGVECIVELSHRLADLAGAVVMEVVGDRTQWSNYRRLLDDLDPRIASYRGGVPAEDVPDLIARADLLVQPSKYEPFGLTAGEALASGVPVVATDAVGAVEDVSRECARRVPIGDVAALERAVRSFVVEIQAGEKPRLAARARAEAERLFDPRTISASIATALEELAA